MASKSPIVGDTPVPICHQWFMSVVNQYNANCWLNTHVGISPVKRISTASVVNKYNANCLLNSFVGCHLPTSTWRWYSNTPIIMPAISDTLRRHSEAVKFSIGLVVNQNNGNLWWNSSFGTLSVVTVSTGPAVNQYYSDGWHSPNRQYWYFFIYEYLNSKLKWTVAVALIRRRSICSSQTFDMISLEP